MTGTDNYLFKGQWVVRTLTTGVKASFHCDPLSNNITASNPTTSWLDFLSCNAQYSHDGQYFQGCTFETESSTMSAQRSCMASEVDEVVDDDASDISDDIDFDFGNNDDYTPPVLGKAPKSPKDKIGSGSTYAALNSEENCNDQHLATIPQNPFRDEARQEHGRNAARQQFTTAPTSFDNAMEALTCKYEKSFDDNLEVDPDSGDVFGATRHKDENSMVIEAYDASSSGVHPVVDPTTMREVLQAGKVDTEDATSDDSENSDDEAPYSSDRVADPPSCPRGGDSMKTFARASFKTKIDQGSTQERGGPQGAAKDQKQLPSDEDSGVAHTHKRSTHQPLTITEDVFEEARPHGRSAPAQFAPRIENDRGWRGPPNDIEMEQISLPTLAPTGDQPIKPVALVDTDMKQPSLPSSLPSLPRSAFGQSTTSWSGTRQPSAQPRSYQRYQSPVHVFQASPNPAVRKRKPTKPQNHTFQISSTIHTHTEAFSPHPSIHAPARQLSKVRDYLEKANETWLRQYRMDMKEFPWITFFDLCAIFVSWDIGGQTTEERIVRPHQYIFFLRKVKKQPPHTRFRVILHFEHMGPEDAAGVGKRRVLDDGKDHADPDLFRGAA